MTWLAALAQQVAVDYAYVDEPVSLKAQLTGFVLRLLVVTALQGLVIRLVCRGPDNPFRLYGEVNTWLRCLVVVFACSVVSFFPLIGGVLSIILWIVLIRVLFERDRLETVIIWAAMQLVALAWFVGWSLLTDTPFP